MVHLIDKDALVAEIKKRIQESLDAGGATRGVYLSERMKEDSYILSLINTLEVKGVDLVKEYDNFQDLTLARLVNRNAGIVIAKHFYSLGLAQKGE